MDNNHNSKNKKFPGGIFFQTNLFPPTVTPDDGLLLCVNPKVRVTLETGVTILLCVSFGSLKCENPSPSNWYPGYEILVEFVTQRNRTFLLKYREVLGVCS